MILVFLTLTSLHAQNYNAYVNAGEKSFADGDYYSAKNYFQKALEFENADIQVKYRAGESARLFNDYYSAAVYYSQTIRDDKEQRFPLAMFWLATMNKMTEEYGSAKNLFYQYYNQHARDSDYYSQRAHFEITECDKAMDMLKDTVPADVRNVGNRINTVYSDFAGQFIKDSILYYSSLRFENKDLKTKKTKNYVSKILAAKTNGTEFRQPQALDTSFNLPDMHNCNATFSADNKLMIFTRCANINFSQIRCELYESKNLNGKWSSPVRLNDSINLKEFTATQPSVATNGAEGYILYFVSDRPGGFGKLDIWKSSISANGKYSQPENLGSNINTIDDEITPFFHTPSQTLYFSSEGHGGLGGYDIFKSAMTNSIFGPAVNAGYPLNSSYQDLYFTLHNNGEKGLLSSNRPGSMYIKNKTCCYDIYSFNLLKKDTAVKDTSWLSNKDSINTITPSEIIKPHTAVTLAKELLPLALYFHNDEPEPRTTKTTTPQNYRDLYTAYIAMRGEYETKYSNGLSSEQKNNAVKSVDDFFDATVVENYNRLEKFSSLLLEELKSGKKVKITVRGFTSPLAKSGYNINLSKRRISSFLNYLKTFQDGALKNYVQNKMLFIAEDPAGESYVKQGVSDNLSDKKNSVYSPDASSERKIQVIDLTIEN